jgi:hypothetical protein
MLLCAGHYTSEGQDGQMQSFAEQTHQRRRKANARWTDVHWAGFHKADLDGTVDPVSS